MIWVQEGYSLSIDLLNSSDKQGYTLHMLHKYYKDMRWVGNDHSDHSTAVTVLVVVFLSVSEQGVNPTPLN